MSRLQSIYRTYSECRKPLETLFAFSIATPPYSELSIERARNVLLNGSNHTFNDNPTEKSAGQDSTIETVLVENHEVEMTLAELSRWAQGLSDAKRTSELSAKLEFIADIDFVRKKLWRKSQPHDEWSVSEALAEYFRYYSGEDAATLISANSFCPLQNSNVNEMKPEEMNFVVKSFAAANRSMDTLLELVQEAEQKLSVRSKTIDEVQVQAGRELFTKRKESPVARVDDKKKAAQLTNLSRLCRALTMQGLPTRGDGAARVAPPLYP